MTEHPRDEQSVEALSRVVGRRWAGQRPALSWLLPVFYLGFAGFQFARGSVFLAAVSVLLAGLFARMSLRPPTVVDERGVYRPWRWRRRFVLWTDIDSVLGTPLKVFPGSPPRLVLRDGGRPVLLDDIPSDQAELVARIGGRPLRRPPVPGVPTAGSVRPREKVRNDSDVEADVTRRAAALDRRWADLEAENRNRLSCRGGGTTQTPVDPRD